MILYTSDNKKQMYEFYVNKRIKPYCITAVFCVLFAYIYYWFSHGVTSPHLTYLFLYPLLLGVANALVCMFLCKTKFNYFFATHFYHTGVVALVLSSILRGIFEIAGTASAYQTALAIIGVLMLLCGALCFMFKK